MESKFRERLRVLRKEEGLTQKKLAEYIGTSDDCIFYWETGRSEPGINDIIKLANFFQVSTDYLLGVSDRYDIL